jgi:cell division protein ZipA
MMEDNLRTALMIISAIAILAILAHGLWKIRRNRNPYKLKTHKDNIEPLSRQVDRGGFDHDGVGAVRVVKTSSTNEIKHAIEPEVAEQPAPVPDYNEEPIPQDLTLEYPPAENHVLNTATEESSRNDKQNNTSSSSTDRTANTEQVHNMPDNIMGDEIDLGFDFGDANDQSNDKGNEQSNNQKKIEPVISDELEPLYETPVTKQKPQVESSTKSVRSRFQRNKSTQIAKEQIEINFDDNLNKKSNGPDKTKKDIEPEIIVLSVVMPDDQQMSGAALLPALLTLGMRYGEMNIFHRHQDNAGNGRVTFCLANIMNPGTFDVDNMESFYTKGISLFMTLPNPDDAFIVFEQMLNAAKQLAQEFNAQILDDKRSVMTKQTEQHYISRIREFDRKYRISVS